MQYAPRFPHTPIAVSSKSNSSSSPPYLISSISSAPNWNSWYIFLKLNHTAHSPSRKPITQFLTALFLAGIVLPDALFDTPIQVSSLTQDPRRNGLISTKQNSALPLTKSNSPRRNHALAILHFPSVCWHSNSGPSGPVS